MTDEVQGFNPKSCKTSCGMMPYTMAYIASVVESGDGDGDGDGVCVCVCVC
jgi:hypothetical protein